MADFAFGPKHLHLYKPDVNPFSVKPRLTLVESYPNEVIAARGVSK